MESCFSIVYTITFEWQSIKLYTSFQPPLASNCEGLLDILTRTFNSVIRGFYYYRKYWSPKIGQNFVYSRKRNNTIDIFAIKTCKEDG